MPPYWKHAELAGIDIPTLCYMKEYNEIGACRLCLVEVKGARGSRSSMRTARKRWNGNLHKHATRA